MFITLLRIPRTCSLQLPPYPRLYTHPVQVQVSFDAFWQQYLIIHRHRTGLSLLVPSSGILLLFDTLSWHPLAHCEPSHTLDPLPLPLPRYFNIWEASTLATPYWLFRDCSCPQQKWMVGNAVLWSWLRYWRLFSIHSVGESESSLVYCQVLEECKMVTSWNGAHLCGRCINLPTHSCLLLATRETSPSRLIKCASESRLRTGSFFIATPSSCEEYCNGFYSGRAIKGLLDVMSIY
jgi:hypothetical protein